MALSILVLRALGLGDLLTGVPALRALRRARPDEELVLAAPRVLQPLVQLTGAVDRVVDAKGLQSLELASPDLAVNLHGKGPESHRILQELQPGRLVAFGCPDAGHAGPAWCQEEHEVRRWCRLLEEELGIDADPTDLRLATPPVPAPAPGAVVIHPGAAFPSRRWPPERFAAVGRWAAARGRPVVVTGSGDEVSLAAEVARLAGLPETAVLAGRTDLSTLAAQVASAALVVSGDTGVGHLASAYAVPSVLLFGPTPPRRWGPPADGPHEVLWHGDGAGDPWGEQVDPALLRVSVEEVLSAASRLMAG